MNEDARDIRLGPFRLGDPIASGGMGTVWRAVHDASNTDVAVKVISGSRAGDEAFARSFRREVQAVAALDHPHVVRVFDYGHADAAVERATGGVLVAGSPWLAMELAESTTRDRPPRNWAELKRTLLALLDALAHAHARDLVHRDLKPENILRVSNGARTTHKLSDFGISHARSRALKESLDGVNPASSAGTPLFMAPEQFEGKWREYGAWTDLYAVGCVAYYWAAGEPPFDAPAPLQLAFKHCKEPLPELEPRFRVPDGFSGWIERMARKSPHARPRFAADAARALADLPDRVAGSEEGVEHVDLLEMATLPEAVLSTVPMGLRVEIEALPDDGEPAPFTDGDETAEIPGSWRRAVDAAGPAAWLAGVGRGLFGLRDVPFVDRDELRDELWEQLRRTSLDGRPRLALLRGVAGAGKTRTATWLMRRAHEVGAASVLRASHDVMTGPEHGFGSMLAVDLACIGLPLDEAAERLASDPRCAGLSDADRGVLLEVLRPALDADEAGPGDIVTPWQRNIVIENLLSDMTRHRPAILFLDDVQWGAESLEIVSHLLRTEKSCRVLVVGTLRTDLLEERPHEAELLDRLHTSPAVRRMPLDALPREHRPALVRRMLPFRRELADRVAEHTQGNPLFTVQLVDSWLENDRLVDTGDGFALEGGARGDDFPASLAALWELRIDDFLGGRVRPESAAEMLEAAAALGIHVPEEQWTAVLEQRELVASPDLIEGLVRRGLVRRTDAGFVFGHSLIVDRLHARSRQAGRWRSLNQSCASALRAAGLAARPGGSERIGEHYLRADCHDAALDHLLDAARERILRDEFAEAARLCDLADRCLEQLELPAYDERIGWTMFCRIHAIRSIASLDETEQRTTELREWADTHDHHELLAHVYVLLSSVANGRGDSEKAVELAGRSRELFEEHGTPLDVAHATDIEGYALHFAGRHVEGIEKLERALALREAEGYEFGIVASLDKLGYCHAPDEPEKARAYYERGIELARKIHAREEQAHMLDGLGGILRHQSNFESALALHREAGAIFEELGAAPVWMTRFNAGLCLIAMGDFETAEVTMRECVDALSEIGVHNYWTYSQLGLAVCLAHHADADEVEAAFDAYARLQNEVAHYGDDIAWLGGRAAFLLRRRGMTALAERARRLGERYASRE